jgi:pyruvate ferredoxin oxidoreductase gamma subunit
MFQVRIHGRGGQGVVSAAEMLSIAAFEQQLEPQAFPSFGSERTGAPVVAFCRIDARPIRTRDPIARPDLVVVADPGLLHQVDVFGGLGDGGYVLINTERTFAELGLGELAERFDPGHLLTLPASEIAREELGRPLPNAALLAGVSALTRVVTLRSILTAINVKFPSPIAGANSRAAIRAHALAMETLGEPVAA